MALLNEGKYYQAMQYTFVYQVKLSHARRKILNQMYFAYISVILVGQQVLSGLLIFRVNCFCFMTQFIRYIS